MRTEHSPRVIGSREEGVQGRPSIQTPNGRTYYGRPPESLGTKGEAPYIAKLAIQVEGLAEVVLPCGRADVATSKAIFEVEPVAHWRHGAQQVFAYAAMTGCAPCLALFGYADYAKIYAQIRERIQLSLALWIFDGFNWQMVTGHQVLRGIRYQIERQERYRRQEEDQAKRYADAPTLLIEDRRQRTVKRALRESSLYDLASEL
jgi:hypothetical protein